jgi:two-component system sensor histidine kinase RegB
MLDEAAAPYMTGAKPIYIFVRPLSGTAPADQVEPIAIRRPGVLYGLGNILENAVDFARTRVDLTAEWDGSNVVVTIADDGPGFKPEIIDSLGEPYVTTRGSALRRASGKAGGLGLGFFIAKTLLERSGARVALENRPQPQSGAIIRLNWPRAVFEAEALRGGPGTALPSPQSRPPSVEVFDR